MSMRIEVVKVVKEIIKSYLQEIKKIMIDNGSEFMDAQSIKKKEIKYFYTHSYYWVERGSNENNNKLMRRFLQKERNFKEVIKKEIKQLEKYINEYRRKLFGEKNSKEIFEMEYLKCEN